MTTAMRHRKAGRQLGRNATHRLALMRNMTRGADRARADHHHGRQGQGSASLRREAHHPGQEGHPARPPSGAAAPRLGGQRRPARQTGPDGVSPATRSSRNCSRTSRHASPNGPAATRRVIKRHQRRLGDAGHTAFLELLKAGETKVQRRKPAAAPAPAPRVTETPAPKAETPPAEAPKPETPPAEAPESETPPA